MDDDRWSKRIARQIERDRLAGRIKAARNGWEPSDNRLINEAAEALRQYEAAFERCWRAHLRKMRTDAAQGEE